jgi:hypothetical protein
MLKLCRRNLAYILHYKLPHVLQQPFCLLLRLQQTAALLGGGGGRLFMRLRIAYPSRQLKPKEKKAGIVASGLVNFNEFLGS